MFCTTRQLPATHFFAVEIPKSYVLNFNILIYARLLNGNLFAVGVLFFWNIGVGSVEMSFFDFLGVLTKHQPDSTLYQIVWKIRLPRIIAAVLLGGALSVSGFLLQSFFQNPIAGPYVLGISSGAKLVVALTMIFLLEKGIYSVYYQIPLHLPVHCLPWDLSF